MRFSIKLFEYRYVLKIFFPTERHIKWLPAIMWVKVKCATKERSI